MIDDDTIVEKRLLDQVDRNSITWRKLKEHFEERLHELRVRNDNDCDPISTARLRGEVASVKYLLALGDQDPATEADED